MTNWGKGEVRTRFVGFLMTKKLLESTVIDKGVQCYNCKKTMRINSKIYSMKEVHSGFKYVGPWFCKKCFTEKYREL